MNKKERESLDVTAAKPDSTESNSESPEQETSVKTGLVAQIKSKFAALVLRFKKAPAPDAAENQDKDTRRRSKDESKDTGETPEKLGLVDRVKSNLGAFISLHKKLLIFTLLLLSLIGIVYAAWNMIFPPLERKHGTDKTPTHESASPEQSQIDVEALKKKSEEEQAHAEAPKKDSPEQTQAGAEALKKKSEEEQAHAEAPKKDSPEQTQAGAEGLMKKSEEVRARVEAPKKKGSEQAQTEAEALKNKSEDAQALAEALKKESEDAQAQAEILKKQSEAAQARAEELRKKEAEEKARVEALKKSPPPNTGEVTVGSKDPKAAAKSLKEAIETMNAGSGEPSRKPAK